jgi:uncharacterized protein involved in exopolysaccharide biosynthesis
MAEENKKQEEQFDIVWLLLYLWSKRKFVLICIGIATFIAVVKYISTDAKYKASASILPVVDEGMASKLGNMGGLAAMAGVDLSKGTNGNIITADLYPKVALSTPFLMELMNVKVKWYEPDTVMSLYEHVQQRTPSFGDYLKAYTIGLPGTIKSWFATEDETVVVSNIDESEPEFVVLSRDERIALGEMSEMIIVEEDPIYSTIEVSCYAESPEQASLLASKAVSLLQKIITEYKTKRARQSLAFIEDRYNETMRDYEKIREQFYFYKDSHRDMISERVDIAYQKLSDEYQISYSLLQTLSSQMEKAKMTLMENTPVFSIVEPVVMPKEKDSPSAKWHIVLGVFLGGFLSVGWLLMQLAWWQLFNEKKVKSLIEEYKVEE